ncbi:DUF559 domain-containing protein [Lacinutrix salivirga]
MLNYIVDFYYNEIGLVIEIDGVSYEHSFIYDAKKQGELEVYGVAVLRLQSIRCLVVEMCILFKKLLHFNCLYNGILVVSTSL